LKTPKIISPQQAYERLADACSRAEYCTYELREKLRRWRIAPADAESIVRRLSEERFVDDARYARAFARQKSEYGRWGRRKIACALAAKRIGRAVATEAMNAIDANVYEASLRAVISARARALGPEALTTYEGRTRLFRHAVSRGYETEVIACAIRTLTNQ